jgi:hypothetical protein
MNREYYDSLSESYQSIYEKYEKEGGHDYSQVGRALQRAASAGGKVAKSYGMGLLQNRKVSSKANPAYRASNLVGRVANTLSGGMAKRAADTAKAAGKLYKGAEKYVRDSAAKTRRGWSNSRNEEVDALMALGFNEDEAVGILTNLIEQEMNEERKDEAGKDDTTKMRDRNKAAGYKPGNTYATTQRRMRGASLRGKQKVKGAKTPEPTHLTPAQQLAHRTGMTKARLAQKYSGTAAGRQQIANNAMDAAERGQNNRRGS